MIILSDIKEKASKGISRGLTYGFEELDNITGGAKESHLTFLVASPKRYKSWIAIKAFIERRREGSIPIFIP